MSGGSVYNYFRDYSPDIGRYIESDPIGLRGGINTYSYVDGNPVAARDVRGLAGPAARGTYYPRGQMPRPPSISANSNTEDLFQTISDYLDPYNPNFGQPIPGWPSKPAPICSQVCDPPNVCSKPPARGVSIGNGCYLVCDTDPQISKWTQ